MIDALKRWGYVVLFAIAAVVLYALTVGKVKLDINTEIKAAKAEAEVKKIQAEEDYATAIQYVEKQYADTIADLNTVQQAEAASLRGDPGALTRFLVRVGAKV